LGLLDLPLVLELGVPPLDHGPIFLLPVAVVVVAHGLEVAGATKILVKHAGEGKMEEGGGGRRGGRRREER
jgi:hypothetical protein